MKIVINLREKEGERRESVYLIGKGDLEERCDFLAEAEMEILGQG